MHNLLRLLVGIIQVFEGVVHVVVVDVEEDVVFYELVKIVVVSAIRNVSEDGVVLVALDNLDLQEPRLLNVRLVVALQELVVQVHAEGLSVPLVAVGVVGLIELTLVNVDGLLNIQFVIDRVGSENEVWIGVVVEVLAVLSVDSELHVLAFELALVELDDGAVGHLDVFDADLACILDTSSQGAELLETREDQADEEDYRQCSTQRRSDSLLALVP